eukprot:tig00020780_g13820.t1
MWLCSRQAAHARLRLRAPVAAARASRRSAPASPWIEHDDALQAASIQTQAPRDRAALAPTALRDLMSPRGWSTARLSTEAGGLATLPTEPKVVDEDSGRSKGNQQGRRPARERFHEKQRVEELHDSFAVRSAALAVVAAFRTVNPTPGEPFDEAEARAAVDAVLQKQTPKDRGIVAASALTMLARFMDLRGAELLARMAPNYGKDVGERGAFIVYAAFRCGDVLSWRHWARLYRVQAARDRVRPSRRFLGAAARGHALGGEMAEARAVLRELEPMISARKDHRLCGAVWGVFSEAVGQLAALAGAGRPLPAPPRGLSLEEARADAEAGGGEAGRLAAYAVRARALLAVADEAGREIGEEVGRESSQGRLACWMTWAADTLRQERIAADEAAFLATSRLLLRAGAAARLDEPRRLFYSVRFGTAPETVADLLMISIADTARLRTFPAALAALAADLGIPDGPEEPAAWAAALREPGARPFQAVLGYKVAQAKARLVLASEETWARAGPEGRRDALRWLQRAAWAIPRPAPPLRPARPPAGRSRAGRRQAVGARGGATAEERAEAEAVRETVVVLLERLSAVRSIVTDALAVRWCTRLMDRTQWPLVALAAQLGLPLVLSDSARGRLESMKTEAEARERDRLAGKAFVPSSFVPDTRPQKKTERGERRGWQTRRSRSRQAAIERARQLSALACAGADAVQTIAPDALDPAFVPEALLAVLRERPRFVTARCALVGTIVKELVRRGDEERAERLALVSPAIGIPFAAGVVLPIVSARVSRGDAAGWLPWWRRFSDSRALWEARRAAGHDLLRLPADDPASPAPADEAQPLAPAEEARAQAAGDESEEGAGAAEAEAAEEERLEMDRWEGTLEKAACTGFLLEGGPEAEAEAAALTARFTPTDAEWVRVHALQAALALAALPQRDAASSAPRGLAHWRARAAQLSAHLATRTSLHPVVLRDWANRFFPTLAPEELVAVYFAGREMFEGWPGERGEVARMHWWGAAAEAASLLEAPGFLRATEAVRCAAAALRAAELVGDRQDVGHVVQLIRPLLEARGAPGLGLPAAMAVVDALVRGRRVPVDGVGAAIRLANLLLNMRLFSAARHVAETALRSIAEEEAAGASAPLPPPEWHEGGKEAVEAWTAVRGGTLLDGRDVEESGGGAEADWQNEFQLRRAIQDLRHISQVAELMAPVRMKELASDIERRLQAGGAVSVFEFFPLIKAAELFRDEAVASRVARLLRRAQQLPGTDPLFCYVNEAAVMRFHMQVPQVMALLTTCVRVWSERSAAAPNDVARERMNRMLEHLFKLIINTFAAGEVPGAGPAEAEDVVEWLGRLNLRLDHRSARALVQGYERVGLASQAWRCEATYVRPKLRALRAASDARASRPRRPSDPLAPPAPAPAQ